MDAKDKMDRTALMRASENGHLETVQTLIEHKAEVNAVDKSMQTALVWAALRQVACRQVARRQAVPRQAVPRQAALRQAALRRVGSPRGAGVKAEPPAAWLARVAPPALRKWLTSRPPLTHIH